MQELTKAQEEILKALWQIKEGAVSDVMDALPDPKPAYTTVATVIKVLEKKEYVSHKTYGKTHVYFPIVEKRDYAGNILKTTVKSFYNNSANQMVSHFLNNKKLSLHELEEMKDLIESQIKKQQ